MFIDYLAVGLYTASVIDRHIVHVHLRNRCGPIRNTASATSSASAAYHVARLRRPCASTA